MAKRPPAVKAPKFGAAGDELADKALKPCLVTTLCLGDEATAQRREGGWDETHAMTSLS